MRARAAAGIAVVGAAAIVLRAATYARSINVNARM